MFLAACDDAGFGSPASVTVVAPAPAPVMHELEVIADPRHAADFLLNPKADSNGSYAPGTTVTIDVIPESGWQVDEWYGPVYGADGETSQINMNASHSVLVRFVREDLARR